MTDVESDNETVPVAIRLFGKWSVLVQGETLPRLRARAGQSLLALLVLRAQEPVERNWLAATLWPDSDEEQARYNLRRNLTDLRRALGREAVRIESPSPRMLRLDLRNCFCDVLAFDAARSASNAADHQLEQAVSLYRGPLLAEFAENWVVQEREARAHSYLSFLETLAQKSALKADWTGAIHYLRLAVAADVYHEPAQCALMKALAAAGDMAGATLVYRDFRVRLHEDLQVQPARETTELYQSLRTRAREALSPAAKIRYESGATVSRVHLPRPLYSLVGRGKELAEIETYLRSARLVTLLGTGGIGKTRLAIAAAEQADAHLAEETWFVDLSSLSSDVRIEQEVRIEQVIADTLGVRAQPGRTVKETLLNVLGQRPVLLVLDNCEHVLGGVARLATDLLPACPNLHILTTSRQALGVAGEVIWRVPPLSIPSDADSVCDGFDGDMEVYMRQFDAVRLFVERALEASPHWSLNSRKLAAIVSICRRLDGIPLALELAAVRVKVLAVEQIAERLEDAFTLLTGSRGMALARHQTLRAAMDWSYDLLTDAEQQLLARLSVFAGGCTLDAVEAIGGHENRTTASLLDTLSELVDKSLVLVEENAAGQLRYRLLETIRQYGQEKLKAAGNTEEIERLHGDYYLVLAQQAEKHLSDTQQADWLNRLEVEHDNLRRALGSQTETERGLRLASSLVFFWRLRGYLREGLEWLSRLLAADAGVTDEMIQAKARNGAGALAYDMGDFRVAHTYYRQSLAIYQKLNQSASTAALLVNLGNVAYRQRDYRVARSHYDQALALYRDLEQVGGIASALGSLGNVSDAEGDYPAARCFQEESLVLSRSLGDNRMTAYTLHNLANLAVREGATERAIVLYEESLTMKRALGDRRGIAALLISRGMLAAEKGDFVGAGNWFTEAISLAHEIEDKLSMISALEGLAWQASTLDQPLYAARLCGAAERGREILQIVSSQEERDLYDRLTEAAYRQTSEQAFANAWAAGRALSLEQAAREVLGKI